MAYQNVGTPRFYISIFPWLKSLGIGQEEVHDGSGTFADMGVFDLNPSSQWLSLLNSDHVDYSFDPIPLGKINF